MEYRRLPFWQYFINTSEDYNKTGKVSFPVEYKAVSYSGNGFQKFLGIKHEVNYEIHYESDRNVIQLNFQRTVDVSDWFANIFEFSSRYYDAISFENRPLQLRVHHGWANMYLTIKHEIRDSWRSLHDAHPDAETEILGWSLGSALAILCCQDLNYNFDIKPHLFTFGSVKPFKAKRKETASLRRYLDTVSSDCRNFTDVNDIVTYMPPFRGFRMVNRVDVGTDRKRTMWRLLHPFFYHTKYDREELYDFQDDSDHDAPTML